MAIVTLPDGTVNGPVESTISWPAEDFFSHFWRFCSISSLQAVYGHVVPWADGRTPTLPLGQPISLSALIPGPGDRTPAYKYYTAPSGGNDSDSKTIDAAVVPLAAVVDYQWRIQIVDYADKTKEPAFKKETISIFENGVKKDVLQDILAVPGVDYTILSGNLNSRQLTIVPTPTSSLRALRISLKISLWWPSRDRMDFQIPKTQGTPTSHANNTTWAAPDFYYLQCMLSPLIPATIPRVPNDDIYSKFPALCSVDSQQLSIGSSTTLASIAAVGSTIPFGQALSLTSQIPANHVEIPKAGLPLPDGTKIGTPGGLPLGAQVSFKWQVETADFLPNATPTKYVEARPSLSHSDMSGRFDVVSGGMFLPTLSFLPWPESSVTVLSGDDGGRAPSQMKRAFRVRLEVTLTAPTRTPVTFYLPPPAAGNKAQYLVGVVDSWASAFGVATPDGSPKLADLPGSLEDLKGAPDSTQLLRGLFTTAIGDLTPEPGHITNLLVTPTDKTKQIPSQLKEIINTKPNTKIEAAIDLGAALDNVAKGALGLFGVKSDNNPAAATALNVLDVLTNIFAIPIAVDINGSSVTHTLTPLLPVPIPSLESVPGAPPDLVPEGLGSRAIIGQVPVGGLKTLVGTSVNDLSWAPISAKDVKVSRLSDNFGLSFLPIPVFQAVGSTNRPAPAVLDIKLRINISVPGSSMPITLKLNLARFELQLPVVNVPQILGLTRFPLNDFPGDPKSPYFNESLWFVDPPTARFCSSVGAVQAILTTLGNTLKAIFKVIKPNDLIDSQVEMYAGWTNLAQTIGLITNMLSSAQAINPSGPHFITAAADQLVTLNNTIGDGPWYERTGDKWNPGGVSTILWVGVPQSKYGVTLTLNQGTSDVAFWLPSAYGSSYTSPGFPRATDKPYTTFSFTTNEYDANGSYQKIWVTESGKPGQRWPGELPWHDRTKSVQFKTMS